MSEQEYFNVADIFGENVFNDSVMQERLPKKVYKKLHEVMEEGKELDHCVAAHYMKPYANGETILLCVRNIEDKDKPLVTVEVKNRKVVQAYGIHDTKPPKDVLEFLDKYKKEVLSKSVKKAV